jgi:hypothetical protein
MALAVKDKVEGVASSVGSTAEEAWDSTRHAASAVAHTAGDAWGELTGLMRRYPFGTLFVGVGFGFLLSRLLEDRAREYASDMMSRLRGQLNP